MNVTLPLGSPPPGALTEFPHADGTIVDPASGCIFRALDQTLVCEGHAEEEETVGADTLDECLSLCQERADCGGVKDSFVGTPLGHACTLHLSTCDMPGPNPFAGEEDYVAYYVKYCAGADADAGSHD